MSDAAADDLDATGPAAPPRRNGELVFAAPWERRLFGVTMALHERGVVSLNEVRTRLIEEIAAWQARGAAGGEYHYYVHWERALRRVLASRGLVADAELAGRTAALAARPEGHDHHDHDHDHDHDH